MHRALFVILLCLSLTTPAAALPAGARVLHDLPYGNAPRQQLDVYLPREAIADTTSLPVIVMAHGGGWRFGDKASPGVVGAKAAHWLPRGFVLVSVNYRMLPAYPVATQADDLARAVAHVQKHARDWGGDPARIVLMGHSAGAHLAALVSAAPSRWRGLGLRPWLGTVALDGAALDVEAVMRKRHLRLLDNAFGDDPAAWPAVSPAAVLEAGAPPLLAVCSTTRRDDSCAQSRSFAARAQRVGVRAQVLPQALSHAEVNKRLGESGAYTAAVDRFLASLDPALARRLAASALR
jgi:acetyl esterase/lipase